MTIRAKTGRLYADEGLQTLLCEVKDVEINDAVGHSPSRLSFTPSIQFAMSPHEGFYYLVANGQRLQVYVQEWGIEKDGKPFARGIAE